MTLIRLYHVLIFMLNMKLQKMNILQKLAISKILYPKKDAIASTLTVE